MRKKPTYLYSKNFNIKSKELVRHMPEALCAIGFPIDE
jgi:hypothetical protein